MCFNVLWKFFNPIFGRMTFSVNHLFFWHKGPNNNLGPRSKPSPQERGESQLSRLKLIVFFYCRFTLVWTFLGLHNTPGTFPFPTSPAISPLYWYDWVVAPCRPPIPTSPTLSITWLAATAVIQVCVVIAYTISLCCGDTKRILLFKCGTA